jgi:hypothetical protein
MCCQGNAMAAKAWAAHAKACAAKAMPWLPRLATAKAWAAKANACPAKAMPWLPRLARLFFKINPFLAFNFDF